MVWSAGLLLAAACGNSVDTTGDWANATSSDDGDSGSSEPGTTAPAGDDAPTPTTATPVVTPTAPVITSFAANPAAIVTGASSMLSWTVSGEGVTLKLNNATVTGTSKVVSPGVKTTYTLSATNQGGTVSATATINVSAPVDDPFVVQIDNSLIPTGDPGVGTDMLVATTEVPPPSDIGAFRTGCKLTHMSYDDPVMYPGQPGKSQLHAFFGNTGVNASSTATSIATTGNSTCRGGTINRTAYWVPAMVDTRTHRPLAPVRESNFYYKTGYSLPPASIQPMPAGLRMVAGNPQGNPTTPNDAVIYACAWDGGNSNWSKTIPTDCPKIGFSWLIMAIDFPQCWDGVNLDSADHRSHMAHPIVAGANNTGHCPATHPIAIPAIAYQILYEVKVTGETAYWRLASDYYDQSQPAGYSGYATWFDGWKQDIVATFVTHCDRAMVDCHSHLLGDGRAMVILP